MHVNERIKLFLELEDEAYKLRKAVMALERRISDIRIKDEIEIESELNQQSEVEEKRLWVVGG